MEENRYIDIHCHAIPFADDGAQSPEESAAMLQRAHREGIGSIILTPHRKPDRYCISAADIRKESIRLQNMADSLQITIKVYPGSELLYNHDLKEELECGSACTLADSRYILVEFLPQEDWRYIRNGIYELVCAGFIPVLAHGERCANVVKDLQRMQELKDLGCLIQVNSASILGKAGHAYKKISRRLLWKMLPDFVATDAHRDKGNRVVAIKKCAVWLKRKCGADYAEKLLFKNAEKILNDSEIQQGEQK